MNGSPGVLGADSFMEFFHLMKQPEYTEGPEALENFKRLATAILQAPAKKQKKQTTSLNNSRNH
jgi:hypothetical protein